VPRHLAKKDPCHRRSLHQHVQVMSRDTSQDTQSLEDLATLQQQQQSQGTKRLNLCLGSSAAAATRVLNITLTCICVSTMQPQVQPDGGHDVELSCGGTSTVVDSLPSSDGRVQPPQLGVSTWMRHKVHTQVTEGTKITLCLSAPAATVPCVRNMYHPHLNMCLHFHHAATGPARWRSSRERLFRWGKHRWPL
jgi:hypothetical protein